MGNSHPDYPDDAPEFMVSGKYEAKCISVYDGDTITVIIFVKKSPYKFKVRVFGVDTPELKPLKNISNRDNIIKLAKEAKDFTSEKVLNKEITLELKGKEKFGRLLAEVFYSDEGKKYLLSEELLKGGYGKEYFGKKKEEF